MQNQIATLYLAVACKTLVVLHEQQLLCFAHADGCLALHTSPQNRSQAPAVQAQDGELTHSLQYTVYQAHQRGLSLCIKCVVGLVSVGTSGTILMWSGDQLASLVQQCGLQLHDRYCHCDSNMHLLHAQKCPCKSSRDWARRRGTNNCQWVQWAPAGHSPQLDLTALMSSEELALLGTWQWALHWMHWHDAGDWSCMNMAVVHAIIAWAAPYRHSGSSWYRHEGSSCYCHNGSPQIAMLEASVVVPKAATALSNLVRFIAFGL